MKYFFLTLLLFGFWGSFSVHAQSVNFEDGFEDDNFDNNPAWSGDTDQFDVIKDGANHLLHLKEGSANGVSYLSVPSTEVVGYWEFYIELDFSPSGSNYAEIFLMSDIADLVDSVNGYALRAGESGSNDVFRIIRYENGSPAESVLVGTTDISSGGGYRVRVTRIASGNWTLEVGQGYSGVLQEEATGTDNTYTTASYFGVKATYTSSRTGKFYFDFRIDLPPFTVTDVTVNESQIIVSFNRAYDQSTAQASDFILNNGVGSPVSVDLLTTTTVQLNFGNPPASDKYTLTAQNIEDLNGNSIAAGSTVEFIVYDTFSAGDVIINEFMYAPPTGQPEYVELKNLSDEYLNLQNWQLADGTGTGAISTDTLTFRPNSFLVISGDTAALNAVYGSRSYIQMADFPFLNNSGDMIDISTGNGNQVDSLRYRPAWGGNEVSLERRSAIAPTVKANFGNSPHPLGGTPSLANKVSDDTTPPGLTNLIINDAQTLTLAFFEKLQNRSATNPANYSLNNGITVSNAQQFAPNSVRLTLGSPLQNNTTYRLSINNQQDIFGNAAPIDTSFTYYVISPVDGDDIYINEFMYDPPPGQTEYIELYNPTDKSLNLQRWMLNDSSGEPVVITESKMILPPDSYAVIAPDETIRSKNPEMLLVTLGSDFPAFNNGGDAIVIRDSTGIILDSLQYSSGWGGQQMALERRTVDVPPIKANFGEAPNGFGSPGGENQIPPDNTPPKLESFAILGSQSLQFVFSEQLTEISATNIENYRISGNLTITNATRAGDTVRISLSGSLQNNTTYTITVKHATDLFGNTSTTIDTSFTYFEPSPVGGDDIYINEFMYNPPSGQTEYIELYNPTSKSLNLQGWTINDNTSNLQVIIEKQLILPPNSYVVIAPDSTLLEQYPNITLIQMGSSFPAFNNSGDDIVIKSANELLLDSLRYTDHWGGNEIALERRTIEAPPLQANFGKSPTGFGTPGMENKIKRDTVPPKLKGLNVLNASTIQLLFSENLTGKSATNKLNYSLTPSINFQLISTVSDTVTLYLAKPLVSEQPYSLSVQNLKDIFGNRLTKATEEIIFIKVSKSQTKDIVINEFLVNREPEFIEFYNRSKKNINLSGWTVSDQNNNIDIDENLIVQPGEYLVITSSSSLARNLDNSVYLLNMPSFNDDEDVIILQNRAGITIDSLYYTPAFGSAIDGKSAERRDPDAASNDPYNWDTNATTNSYTAGAKNSNFQPDKRPPKMVFAGLFANGVLEVRFNEFIKITSKLLFLVNGQPVDIIEFNPTAGNIIMLNTSGISGGQKLTVTAQNVSDASGNKTLSTQIAIAQPLTTGAVVINEIMFDPIEDSDDGLPDQSEYIELYNTKEYAVSLEGIFLHSAPDEDGEIDHLMPVSTHSKWISADATAIIYAGELPNFEETDIADFFELNEAPKRSLIRVNRSSLSLSSTKDAIYLTDKQGVEIDSVFYEESWHNPNLIDTEGIALERINPEGSSNRAANWGSSTAPKGGTPNAENTLFQTPVEVQQKSGISFSSNPFSPDGDGYEDHLVISYKLNQPDYLMTVKIYDRYGRLIIELADSKPAGTKGSLTWDGRKENGNRNRIGIYIVIFRAFDSAGGHDVAFKETVVLARRLH